MTKIFTTSQITIFYLTYSNQFNSILLAII